MDWHLGMSTDRFVTVKTWKHDGSIVYRLTSVTSEVAWAINAISPNVHGTVIFLKVQTQAENPYPAAYKSLEDEHVKLDPDAEQNGLDDNVATVMQQRVGGVFFTTPARKIKEFVDKNRSNIRRSVTEIGFLRVIVIAWAPNGETPRIDEMADFINKNYKVQLTLAQVDKYVKAPLKWALGFFGLSGNGEQS